MLPQFRKIFGEVCTVKYYLKSIRKVEEKISEPVFFIFQMILIGLSKTLLLIKLILLIGIRDRIVLGYVFDESMFCKYYCE